MTHVSTLFIDIDEEFKTQLRNLTPSVLSSEHLVAKSINGGEVTCRGLLEYFKVILTLYPSLQSGLNIAKPKVGKHAPFANDGKTYSACQGRENHATRVKGGKSHAVFLCHSFGNVPCLFVIGLHEDFPR